jgi:putative ABC transport system permease protein
MLQDVRFGLRGLWRSPGFTLVTVLTLGLAAGAATTMYAVVDGVVLRPLAYPRPEQLVQLRQLNRSGQPGPFSDPNFEDLRAGTSQFTAMAEYSWALASVVIGSLPVRIGVAPVSQGFFDVFAASPWRGRRFAAEELREGGPRVAIVSERFWRQHLTDMADLSSARLRLNGEPHTIVGVMPAGFEFPAVQTSGRHESNARAIPIARVTTGKWLPGSQMARRSMRCRRRQRSWRDG